MFQVELGFQIFETCIISERTFTKYSHQFHIIQVIIILNAVIVLDNVKENSGHEERTATDIVTILILFIYVSSQYCKIKKNVIMLHNGYHLQT